MTLSRRIKLLVGLCMLSAASSSSAALILTMIETDAQNRRLWYIAAVKSDGVILSGQIRECGIVQESLDQSLKDSIPKRYVPTANRAPDGYLKLQIVLVRNAADTCLARVTASVSRWATLNASTKYPTPVLVEVWADLGDDAFLVSKAGEWSYGIGRKVTARFFQRLSEADSALQLSLDSSEVESATRSSAPTQALVGSLANASSPRPSIARPAHDSVKNEIRRKAMMMGWRVSDVSVDGWAPCDSATPVTDTSCVTRRIVVRGEVAGTVFDHPSGPPQYQHFVLWKN